MTVSVRPMAEQDLPEADRVLRLAFGTELGLADPASFGGDSDMLRPRWRTDGTVLLVAEEGGELLGSVVVSSWGSLAVLGPLTVRPDHWNKGVARLLLPAALVEADCRGAGTVALYTRPSSPRHLRLYEEAGFHAGHLIAVMAGPAGRAEWEPALMEPTAGGLAACARLTGAVLPGLDLSGPIRAVAEQTLGGTVAVYRNGVLAGFAVCQTGPGSEAGSGTVAVRFAVSEPGALGGLLDAVETYAGARGAACVEVPANLGRRAAYALLKQRGYRTRMTGVAMLRPDLAGYDAPGVCVLEEWR